MLARRRMMDLTNKLCNCREVMLVLVPYMPEICLILSILSQLQGGDAGIGPIYARNMSHLIYLSHLNCREVMLVNIFRLTPTKSEVLDWFSENGSKVNFLYGDGYFLKSTRTKDI